METSGAGNSVVVVVVVVVEVVVVVVVVVEVVVVVVVDCCDSAAGSSDPQATAPARVSAAMTSPLRMETMLESQLENDRCMVRGPLVRSRRPVDVDTGDHVRNRR